MKIILMTKLSALFFLFFSFGQINTQVLLSSDSSDSSLDSSCSSDGFSEEVNSCGILEITSIPDQGKQFELESALVLQILDEKVLGRNLMIEVLDSEKDPKYILLSDGNFFQLKTTEYDIVTTDHVFECKSSSSLAKKCKTYAINQFLKERNMLEFFNQMANELEEGSLSFNVTLKRKGICVLTICGRSTLFQDVSLLSNWVNGADLEICEKQWKDIIQLLSNKTLIVMFKQKITSPVKTRLSRENLEWRDQIDCRPYLMYTEKVERAVKELNALKIY